MVRGDRLIQEGPLYSRRRSRRGTAMLAALTLGVGVSLFVIPLSSVPAAKEPYAPTAVPTPTTANLEEAPNQTQLGPNLIPLDALVSQNFSTESSLRLRILDGKYQFGDDAKVSACADETGQPLTGKVALAEVNVRTEPGTRKPPSRRLFWDTPILSRIKATVTNWRSSHEDTWRGIETPSGNLEFVAQTYSGKTNMKMTDQREICTPIDLEPRVGPLLVK